MDDFICRACGKSTFKKDLRAGCPHCGSMGVELLDEKAQRREEQVLRHKRNIGRGSSPAEIPQEEHH